VQALSVEMIIVVVGDEDHLRNWELLRGQGGGDMATIPGPHISEDRISEDVLPS
jgi:hypothetical protein